jgi:hypothetical protein
LRRGRPRWAAPEFSPDLAKTSRLIKNGGILDPEIGEQLNQSLEA